MKSAYELAMERLKAQDPVVSLNDTQRKKLVEITRRYKAKIAEREIFLKKQLTDALAQNDSAEAEKIKQQIVREKTRLEEELEAEKEKVRKDD